MALSALLLLAGLVVAYAAHIVWQWRRLAHIPGPFSAGFCKWWTFREAVALRLPESYKRLGDQYGSLVRVGPNELITDNPDVLRRTMATKSRYVRGPWYEAFRMDPAMDNVLTMRDEEAHTALRNKILPGFSGKENISLESTIETQIAAMVDLIERKYLSTGGEYRPMDLGVKAQYFTLDVISDLAWGQPMGFLAQDRDVFNYLKVTTMSIPAMMVLSTYPGLVSLLHTPLLRPLLPRETDTSGFGALIGIAKKVAASRFEPDAPDHRDMLGAFIRNGLTQAQVSAESLGQIVAGSDTSASTIRAVMLHVLSNPPVYQKLRAEIDAAVPRLGMERRMIKDAEARLLPYLQAVIREGLRIMPPASAAMFKEVPPEGDTIDGKFIPGGTQIGSNVMAIHRSREIYGPDADAFRPERWLEAEGDRLARMVSTVEMNFHYGKYQCPGRGIALMEFNKLFVEGLWLIDEFWVRISRRE
ncbi:cytochrome P450 [Dichotomopilus funicola]|uniref:Cytochrome P450 n=1 Tax=Dichotomopilus funicola TaxID=1934379 RepID=A0AAN6V5G0_9PEZI|nr:cytochrome P450 [Dichotomopilus funicola]